MLISSVAGGVRVDDCAVVAKLDDPASDTVTETVVEPIETVGAGPYGMEAGNVAAEGGVDPLGPFASKCSPYKSSVDGELSILFKASTLEIGPNITSEGKLPRL